MKIFQRQNKQLTLIFLSLFNAASAFAEIPEIPDLSLQDIAKASWYTGTLPGIPMYNGPVIIYNPTVTSQAGPILTEFFHAHEYCHISLNHIQKIYFMANPYNYSWISQSLELQADTCATQYLISHGNIMSVKAAAQWFLGQGPIQLVPSHPPGQARAFNIINTSKSMGVNL